MNTGFFNLLVGESIARQKQQPKTIVFFKFQTPDKSFIYYAGHDKYKVLKEAYADFNSRFFIKLIPVSPKDIPASTIVHTVGLSLDEARWIDVGGFR
jgi:hypothetical protein